MFPKTRKKLRRPDYALYIYAFSGTKWCAECIGYRTAGASARKRL